MLQNHRCTTTCCLNCQNNSVSNCFSFLRINEDIVYVDAYIVLSQKFPIKKITFKLARCTEENTEKWDRINSTLPDTRRDNMVFLPRTEKRKKNITNLIYGMSFLYKYSVTQNLHCNWNQIKLTALPAILKVFMSPLTVCQTQKNPTRARLQGNTWLLISEFFEMFCFYFSMQQQKTKQFAQVAY